MTPAGYIAKRVARRSEWLKVGHVNEIYSVSGCISANFADYIPFWKHNGFWLFDSPEIIRSLAREHSIDISSTKLFYCEIYEQEFDGEQWRRFVPDTSLATNVAVPSSKRLEGFDVVTFWAANAPECSPLSCNGIAETVRTNQHCLLPSFDEAQRALAAGPFSNSEPGPFRVFAVYSVDWD